MKNHIIDMFIIIPRSFDMIIITWAGGNQCKIHNHPDNGCSVKVLDGDVIEERF